MFEGFNEPARRVIYFGLEEARGLGSKRIDTVHLLLGILREDPSVAARVGAGALDTIRKELEEVAPPKGDRTASSGDLPLSKKAHVALVNANEEAAALGREEISRRMLCWRCFGSKIAPPQNCSGRMA